MFPLDPLGLTAGALEGEVGGLEFVRATLGLEAEEGGFFGFALFLADDVA